MGSDDDREVLEAVRDSTRSRIRVDANEGWTLQGALDRLEWLARLGVELVEQPLPADRIEETRELRRRSPLPFYADESVHRASDIPRLAGAFDGINIKLMKCGGLGEALRMIAVARALGMKVMLGCMIESSVLISAAAQLSPPAARLFWAAGFNRLQSTTKLRLPSVHPRLSTLVTVRSAGLLAQ